MDKLLIMTLSVIVAGLSVTAHDVAAQNSSDRAARMDKWHQEMAEFRARSEHDRQLAALADSLAYVQAAAAVRNQDFVLEADNVSFKNGMTTFVNSNTNFISVKGDRAVVQISPSNFASGPNGLGGVTVDGMITDRQVVTDKHGRITYNMNVMGLGINAQVQIYLTPGSSNASATIYPNFNSNTVWLEGTVVPYENSDVIEGSSL